MPICMTERELLTSLFLFFVDTEIQGLGNLLFINFTPPGGVKFKYDSKCRPPGGRLSEAFDGIGSYLRYTDGNS